MRVGEPLGFACACGHLCGHVKPDCPALHLACHCACCAAAERAAAGL